MAVPASGSTITVIGVQPGVTPSWGQLAGDGVSLVAPVRLGLQACLPIGELLR
jgi:hypothetical protein